MRRYTRTCPADCHESSARRCGLHWIDGDIALPVHEMLTRVDGQNGARNGWRFNDESYGAGNILGSAATPQRGCRLPPAKILLALAFSDQRKAGSNATDDSWQSAGQVLVQRLMVA